MNLVASSVVRETTLIACGRSGSCSCSSSLHDPELLLFGPSSTCITRCGPAFRLHPLRWTDKFLCRFFGAPATLSRCARVFPDHLISTKKGCPHLSPRGESTGCRPAAGTWVLGATVREAEVLEVSGGKW